MRNISFSLTTAQFKNGSKTVTRRVGWEWLRPGVRLMSCVKCMGLKPGQKIERLGEIEVVAVRREPLFEITHDDVKREGFPTMARVEFLKMFCEHMGGDYGQIVTRIEFKKIQERPQ